MSLTIKIHPAPMDQKTFEDARSAWRMQFALQTFKSVRAGMQAMLDHGFTVDSPEYYPLIVGLVCLYGRPFKNSKPAGKLDENIVPKEHKKLHDELILIRDKFFAHSDSSPAPTFQMLPLLHSLISAQKPNKSRTTTRTRTIS